MAGEKFTHGCCTDKKYGKGCTPATCMSLPEGQWCATCVHTDRCVKIFGAKPENTWCDFFPRRFSRKGVVE